ncbi:MAG TPA: response regulator [Candidatus Binataceae bacterium]|nr:response regulator [Candidatus Binataceae bacterium]
MAVDVLIVDDSVPLRTLLKRRLETVGCTVVAEAGDAFEGLKLFRSAKPQLVTLDLMMPLVAQVDAKSMFRSIRKESPETAIIVISAQPKVQEKADYLREGALDYVQKPFIDFEALYEKLRHCFPELARLKSGGPV